MQTKLLLLSISFISLFMIFSSAYSEDDFYYARSNLKVIKGNKITWVNWQSTRTLVHVGTKLKVVKNGKKATLENVETGKSYTLDIGNSDAIFLEKFVSKKQVSIDHYPEDIQRNIKKTTAKIGMTKEQVYISMGPPSWAGDKTHSMTYEQIMAEDLWVHKRKRFGKNIGVSFDPISGKVDRTEGIWGK